MTDSDDRNGQTCTMCCAGYYQGTSIHDDWDGVLHCTNKECNHEVIRYKWKDDPKPQPEPVKSKLSSAAQAVLDAAMDTPEEQPYEFDIAAALRAAADQVCPSDAIEPRNYLPLAIENERIRRELLAIADELEGVRYGTYRCDLKEK